MPDPLTNSDAKLPDEAWREVFAQDGEEPPFWVAKQSEAGQERSKCDALEMVEDAYGKGDFPLIASVVQMYVGTDEYGLTVRRQPEGMAAGPFEFWMVEEDE